MIASLTSGLPRSPSPSDSPVSGALAYGVKKPRCLGSSPQNADDGLSRHFWLGWGPKSTISSDRGHGLCSEPNKDTADTERGGVQVYLRIACGTDPAQQISRETSDGPAVGVASKMTGAASVGGWHAGGGGRGVLDMVLQAGGPTPSRNGTAVPPAVARTTGVAGGNGAKPGTEESRVGTRRVDPRRGG